MFRFVRRDTCYRHRYCATAISYARPGRVIDIVNALSVLRENRAAALKKIPRS